MEQFSLNIYPLINKNNTVIWVHYQHNIFLNYFEHILVGLMVSKSQYISILFLPALCIELHSGTRSHFRV